MDIFIGHYQNSTGHLKSSGALMNSYRQADRWLRNDQAISLASWTSPSFTPYRQRINIRGIIIWPADIVDHHGQPGYFAILLSATVIWDTDIVRASVTPWTSHSTYRITSDLPNRIRPTDSHPTYQLTSDLHPLTFWNILCGRARVIDSQYITIFLWHVNKTTFFFLCCSRLSSSLVSSVKLGIQCCVSSVF